MLASVKKPYLNLDARSPPLLRQASRNIDLSGAEQQSWANIKHLTNEERDQIDLQARVILSRCKDRVSQLEELEKRESLCTSSTLSAMAQHADTQCSVSPST